MASRGSKYGARATASLAEHAAQIRGREAAIEPEAEKDAATLAGVLAREGMPGEWVGKAALAAGLTGEASLDAVTEVLGKGLLNGQRIRNASVRVVSWGLVLALPKTVSVLLASEDPADREAVEAAIRAASNAYIDALEIFVRTRTGAQGMQSEAVEGLLAARYIHRGSSVGDPHAHVHFIVSATAPGRDGKWRTLDGKTVLAGKRVAEAAAMAALRARLSADLGLSPAHWSETLVGSVRVPELAALRDAADGLAGASRHLEEALADMGRVTGSETWAAHQIAWRQTRRGNKGAIAEQIEAAIDMAIAEGGVAAGLLREIWHARAGDSLARGLAALRQREFVRAPAQSAPIADRALAWTGEQHSWTHADLTAWCTGEMDPRAAALEAARLIDTWAEKGLVHASAPVTPTLEAVLAGAPAKTREIHATVGLHARIVSEKAVQDEARLQRHATNAARLQGQRLAVELPAQVSTEQGKAIALMARGRRFTGLTGVSGAGKTTVLKPVAEAARRAGLDVVSVARNAKRGRETGQDIGVTEAMSITALLDLNANGKGTLGRRRPALLVVDEGGVVDRKDWAALLALALDPTRRIQIVGLGDREQAQSIDRRGAWSVVTAGAAAEGQTAHLSKSYRCASWEEEANALRAGEVVAVIKTAKDEQRIIAPHLGEWAELAAETVAGRDGRVALVMTNDEAHEISRLVQEHLGIEAATPIAGDNYAGIGDRVRTRANDYRRGLFNGDRWKVAGVEAGGGLVLEADDGRRVRIDRQYAVASVELDYACTLDAAQGITCQQAIPVVRHGMGRSQLYSAATRGRDAPLYVCVVEDDEAPEAVLARAAQTDDIARSVREIRDQIKAEQEARADEAAETAAEAEAARQEAMAAAAEAARQAAEAAMRARQRAEAEAAAEAEAEALRRRRDAEAAAARQTAEEARRRDPLNMKIAAVRRIERKIEEERRVRYVTWEEMISRRKAEIIGNIREVSDVVEQLRREGHAVRQAIDDALVRLKDAQDERKAAEAKLAKLEARSPILLYWARRGIKRWREREEALAHVETTARVERAAKAPIGALRYKFFTLQKAHREANENRMSAEELARAVENSFYVEDPNDVIEVRLKAELAAARLAVAQEKSRRWIKLTPAESIILVQEKHRLKAEEARTGRRPQAGRASTPSPF